MNAAVAASYLTSLIVATLLTHGFTAVAANPYCLFILVGVAMHYLVVLPMCERRPDEFLGH